MVVWFRAALEAEDKKSPGRHLECLRAFSFDWKQTLFLVGKAIGEKKTMSKSFSPLEVIALSVLPEKQRIAKTAALCRTHRRFPDNQVVAANVLTELGEPRGAKTRLKKALAIEYCRQAQLVGMRRSYTKNFSSGAYDGDHYDPVSYKFYRVSVDSSEVLLTKSVRWKALVAARFAKIRRTALKNLLWWWDGSLKSNTILNAQRIDGVFFMLMRPPYIKTTTGANKWSHNHKYLFYKDGATVGRLRVPYNVSSIQDSIKSFKPARVVKAELKNYDIKVDWENQCFLTKPKNSSKWVKSPFKAHSREKKPQYEAV